MTNNRTPIYVLGTGLSHDGSACLLKDGRICVAIEKERITRNKHDGGNDTDAIKYCLDAAGISIHDVRLVVQNANFGMIKNGNSWWSGPRLLSDVEHVITISHHLAHAYSALWACQFKDSAVIVIDGCGSGLDDCIDLDGAIVTEDPPAELRHLYFEKDSYYTFSKVKLAPVLKDFSPLGAAFKNYPMYPNTTLHSIGGIYLSASKYVFSGFEDPGKLMGLAPYGRPGIYDFEIFELRDGRSYVRYDWMPQFDRPCRSYTQFKENFQYYADIAYWIQREVERAVLYIFNSRYEIAPSDSVAYAGGVALNAVANRRILTETKFKNVYIQPAAGDNGLAVGCAYYGWLEILKKEPIVHNGSVSFGKPYQSDAIDISLSKYNSSLKYSVEKDYISKTAELLANGKIVGWFQGGAELGPRALGNRSILADPRKPEVREFINSHIKLREDFRPFAPSVLCEDVGIYFDCDYESPFMIVVAPVKPDWQNAIPSVIHKDQSARIHTVTQDASSIYYELLCAFKKITGISVLLNTSFNRKGMPIVETPEDAIRLFLSSRLDLLVLDNYLIYKTPHVYENRRSLNITENFIKKIRLALENNEDAKKLGGVYQINITGVRTLTIDLSLAKPLLIEGEEQVNPLATIELAESDLLNYWNNPVLEGRKLFQSGKIKIEGSQGHALGLIKILPIT